jgi:hypothetical protein
MLIAADSVSLTLLSTKLTPAEDARLQSSWCGLRIGSTIAE